MKTEHAIDWRKTAAEIQDDFERICKERDEYKQDAEQWVSVAGYVGTYEVSSKGMVRSIDRIDSAGKKRKQKYLHPTSTTKGYLKVTLWNSGEYKEFYVHRLVASAFVQSDVNCPQVNHKDGDPANNEASNLEWVTNQQNAFHASRTLGRSGNRPIVGTPMNGGDSISFNSLHEAQESGFVRANILKSIKGERSHSSGYVWKYADLDAAIDSARGDSK